jgi:hypothetical protein
MSQLSASGRIFAGLRSRQRPTFLPFSGTCFLPQLENDLDGYTMATSAMDFAVDRPLQKTLVKKLVIVRLAAKK